MKGEPAIGEILKETRDSLWVFTSGDNQVLVGADHENPQTAYQLVNALIDVYLRWQINAEQAESDTANNFFVDVIELYNSELATAREDMVQYVQTHPRPLRCGSCNPPPRLVGRLDMAVR